MKVEVIFLQFLVQSVNSIAFEKLGYSQPFENNVCHIKSTHNKTRLFVNIYNVNKTFT